MIFFYSLQRPIPAPHKPAGCEIVLSLNLTGQSRTGLAPVTLEQAGHITPGGLAGATGDFERWAQFRLGSVLNLKLGFLRDLCERFAVFAVKSF
jgi:hypothetical protein